MYRVLYLLAIVSTHAVTGQLPSLRKIQKERPCNSQISTVTVDEVQQFADFYLRSSLDPSDLGVGDELVELTAGALLNGVQYNIIVHKICGSCGEVSKYVESNKITTFENICGSDVHGFDAIHSSLVFIPQEQGGTLPHGKIPSFVSMHSFRTSLEDCPTKIWPDSVEELIEASEAANAGFNFLVGFQDFFAGLVIASSGTVSIFPDYIGYGESTSFSRTNMKESYAQAAVVSYAATGSFLKTVSGACSLLDSTGSMYGSSEGGFAVIPAAEALQDVVDLKAVDSAAGPLNSLLQLAFVVDSLDDGRVLPSSNNIVFNAIAPFFGFIHSNDIAGLANTGDRDQRFLSDAFQDATNFETNVFEWFQGPKALSFPEVLAVAPQNILDTLNPALVGLLRNAAGLAPSDLKTCPVELVEDGVNDLMCKTLEQGILWDIVAKTTLPLQLCFSQEDTVTAAGNFPSFLFDNPSVGLYTPPFPEFTPSGDHLQAQILCNNAPLLSFQANPSVIGELSAEQEEVCKSSQEGGGDSRDGILQQLSSNIFIVAAAGIALLISVVLMYCCAKRGFKW